MDDAPGHAFGIRFEGPLPALVPGGEGLRSCAVERVDEAEAHRRWGDAPAELLSAHRATDGSVLVGVERRGADLRVAGLGHGASLVLDGGRRLVAAPPEGPAWLRPRLLVAQTLPLLATLRGLEVLHAAAVVLDGRALALTAPPGTGKSSVAAHLRASGAAFLADDALAVEGTLAHPGPRFANVPPHEAAGLDLGTPLGRSEGDLHVAPEGATAPVPLGAVVVLQRGAEPALERHPDPVAALLAATYVTVATDPGRPVRHLDAVATLAREVPVLRCTIASRQDAADVAAVLRAWTLGTEPGGYRAPP